MEKADRVKIIREIEEFTHSKVLVYFTGDKQTFETRIGNDVIPLFYDHLEKIGQQEKITLMLYTNGGITNAGFGIVNLIREYCTKLCVVVPFKCLSTGTLMALGADEILMSKVGQLSPIDPSTLHKLGPQITPPMPGMAPQSIPINVEDVMGYFELAREDAKIDPENMTEIFKTLARSIHPVVLGAIKRAENQVQYMANALLKFHCADQAKNSKIIDELLKQRFSHQYLITRQEAKAIGLPIGDISKIESLVMNLYRDYSNYLGLQSNHQPDRILGNKNQVSATINQAVIESVGMTDVNKTDLELVAVADTAAVLQHSSGSPKVIARQIQENRIPRGWVRGGCRIIPP